MMSAESALRVVTVLLPFVEAFAAGAAVAAVLLLMVMPRSSHAAKVRRVLPELPGDRCDGNDYDA
jgi:hypothetical protein